MSAEVILILSEFFSTNLGVAILIGFILPENPEEVGESSANHVYEPMLSPVSSPGPVHLARMGRKRNAERVKKLENYDEVFETEMMPLTGRRRSADEERAPSWVTFFCSCASHVAIFYLLLGFRSSREGPVKARTGLPSLFFFFLLTGRDTGFFLHGSMLLSLSYASLRGLFT